MRRDNTWEELDAPDVRTLAEIPAHVERLVERLTYFCNQLTPRTYLYVSQLQALCGLVT